MRPPRPPANRGALPIVISRAACVFAVLVFAASIQSALACPSDLDASFGTAGVADVSDVNATFAVPFVQSTGAILIPGALDGRPMVARYREDGTLDPSFGDNGIALIDVPSGEGFLRKLDVQNDGFIVAVGSVGHFETGTLPLLVRLDPAGQLDPAFGDEGMVIVPTAPGLTSRMLDVVVRGDGIVAGLRLTGDVRPPSSVLFFNTNGDLNPAFGTAGIVSLQTAVTNYLVGIVRLDDDSLVIGGVVDNIDDIADTLVARLLADGTPDPSFGNGGVRISRSRSVEEPSAVGVDSLGRILVAGSCGPDYYHDSKRIFVRRYLANGEGDRSYGRRGKASMRFSSVFTGSLVVTGDGQAVVPARFTEDADVERGGIIARFGVDGRRDPAFGRRGVKLLNLGPETRFSAASEDPDGKLVVTGRTEPGEDTLRPLLVRLDGGIWDGEEQCVIGCGDGIIRIGEECDDGNVATGDGCSAGCTIE
jgi:uncharacterized delta-60 repeat protein